MASTFRRCWSPEAAREADLGQATENGHAIPTGAASIGSLDLVHFSKVSYANGFDGFTCGLLGNLGIREAVIASRTAASTLTSQTAFAPQPALGKWSGSSNFSQASLLVHGSYIYLFGTTPGRVGGLKLGRASIVPGVAPTSLEWEYWTGITWSTNESDAVFIVPPGVGELSVQYNETFGRYILTYLSDRAGTIVFRDARTPEGPWSAPKELARHPQVPGSETLPWTQTFEYLYGSYVYPFSYTGDPSTLYFNMSQWIRVNSCLDIDPSQQLGNYYNVKLMASSLSVRPGTAEAYSRGPLLLDPGFDDYLTTCKVASPLACQTALSSLLREGDVFPDRRYAWQSERAGGAGEADVSIERTTLTAPRYAMLRGSDGWRGISQKVAVRPYKNYQITLVGGGSNFEGTYGARAIEGPTFSPKPRRWPSPSPLRLGPQGDDPCYGTNWSSYDLATQTIGAQDWNTSQTVTFNSGPYSLLEVFAGYNGTGTSGEMAINSIDLVQLDVMSDGDFEQQAPFEAVQKPYEQEGLGERIPLPLGRDGSVALMNRASGPNQWNAVTQWASVDVGWYRLSGWFKTGANFNVGYLGVRLADGSILAETSFPPSDWTQRDVFFWSPSKNALKVFAGYWSGGSPTQGDVLVDDLVLEKL